MKKRDLVFLEQVQHTVVVLFDYCVFAANHLRHIKAQTLDLNAMVGKVMAGLLKML